MDVTTIIHCNYRRGCCGQLITDYIGTAMYKGYLAAELDELVANRQPEVV